MPRTHGLGSPARRGLIAVLRTWLQAWSTGTPDVAPATALAPTTPSSVHVLVVDDDPVNGLLVSALLASRGVAPCLAADGAEAVALASELDFDLILMDLQMPILDGLAATAAIRRVETDLSRPAVPVLAYSSSLPEADVLLAAGISGILGKPCDAQGLEACLVRWCPGYCAALADTGAGAERVGLQPAGRHRDNVVSLR